jgi:hypothetical protein
VDQVVMLAAQGQQVLEVRLAAVAPLGEVVDVAVTEAHRTVRRRARPVHRSQRSALIGGR